MTIIIKTERWEKKSRKKPKPVSKYARSRPDKPKFKEVVTARENGKILSWTKKKSSKTLRSYKIKFNKDNTFNQDQKVYKLKNVVEVTDYSKKPKVQSDRFQYVITAKLRVSNMGKPTIVNARSLQYPKGTPIETARADANEIYYERLARAVGLSSDMADQSQSRKRFCYFKERGTCLV